MNVTESVVERHGGYAQNVRLAPVTQNSLRNQPLADGASAALPYAKGELRAAAVRLARREHGDLPPPMLIEQKLQIAGQRLAFLAELSHTRGREYLQRCSQRCHRHNRRIAQLPSLGSGHGVEVWPHEKPALLVVAPPSGEARQIESAGVPFVDEATARASGPTVKVLVVAPDGEVDVPVVQSKGHIPRRMREIKSHNTTLRVPGAGDGLHVKQLARGVVHSPQQHQSDRRTFTFQQRSDVFRGDARLARVRRELDQRGRGIEPMKSNLR